MDREFIKAAKMYETARRDGICDTQFADPYLTAIFDVLNELEWAWEHYKEAVT